MRRVEVVAHLGEGTARGLQEDREGDSGHGVHSRQEVIDLMHANLDESKAVALYERASRGSSNSTRNFGVNFWYSSAIWSGDSSMPSLTQARVMYCAPVL